MAKRPANPARGEPEEARQYRDDTAHLSASLKNAERLNKAIAEIEAGRVVQKGLIEEE